MYARILKFLTNLLFKPYFSGFFPGRKKRKPNQMRRCVLCSVNFLAFNKRQKDCPQKACRVKRRKILYRARIRFAESQKKAIEIAGESKPSVYQTGVGPLESEE